MSRIRLVLVSPSFLIPAGLLLGGLLARSSPTYGVVIDQVYSFLKAETAPSVVLALTSGLGMLAISTLFVGLGDFLVGIIGIKIDKQPDRADAQESPVEARQRWVSERLTPWRDFLEARGELALLHEIEAFFQEDESKDKKYVSPMTEAWVRDLQIMSWLVEKAVMFSSGTVDDDVSAKIHSFVDQAFRLAGQHDGWTDITRVSGAHAVVAPVFRGQTAIYLSQCGNNMAFVKFLAWLASTP